jgi:hypothetical protein
MGLGQRPNYFQLSNSINDEQKFNPANWRDLGFALAVALGENGRSYFHRLSRFYPLRQSSRTRQNRQNTLPFGKVLRH